MPFADPETQRTYQRDYKRLQRAGGCQTPGQTRLPVEFRLKTAADVLALLDEQVAAVRQEDSLGSVERASGRRRWVLWPALRCERSTRGRGGADGSVGVDLEITTEGKGRGMT